MTTLGSGWICSVGQGGRAKGRGNHDDDSDFEDGPKKKNGKANKAMTLLAPAPPTHAVVPELVSSASGGKVIMMVVALACFCSDV